VLGGVVLFVLLLVCANIANLILARGVGARASSPSAPPSAAPSDPHRAATAPSNVCCSVGLAARPVSRCVGASARAALVHSSANHSA
jgi:hypothetical protein